MLIYFLLLFLYNALHCQAGCPVNEITGQCLTFSTDQLSWDDAKNICFDQNGRLAVLNDPIAFRTYVEVTYSGEDWWLGGSDITSEGTWVWLNDDLIGSAFPWNQGEPNAAFPDENCLVLWGGWAYSDAPCPRFYNYVCEKGCIFNGEFYPDGSFILRVCAYLRCDASSGQFEYHGINENCSKCCIWGDPHVEPYWQLDYSYNRRGISLLSGTSPTKFPPTISQLAKAPAPAVIIEIERRQINGGTSRRPSVISGTLKNDASNNIKIEFVDKKTVKVDGTKYTGILSGAMPTSPTTIRSTTHGEVFYWAVGKQLFLLGSSGYFVGFRAKRLEICVWVTPSFEFNQHGLCEKKPTVADCSEPWFSIGNECFYLHGPKEGYNSLDWESARRFCFNQGGDLAQPESILSLADYLFPLHHTFYWLGARNSQQWLDGTSITGWRQGQPENANDCVAIHPVYGANSLFTKPCGTTQYMKLVCEKPTW